MAEIFIVPTSVLRGEQSVPANLLSRLRKVQRLRVGALVRLTDGLGRVCTAKLTSHNLVIESCSEYPDDRLPMDIYFPLVKGDMETAIYQLAQMGVRRIIPTIYWRSVVRTISENKIQRWKRLAMAGLEVRRKYWLTEITKPVFFPFDGFKGCAFVLCPNQGTSKSLPENIEEVSVFIGPEGGFAPEEMEFLTARDAVFVTLKSGVLRSTTATVVGTAVIATLLGWLV